MPFLFVALNMGAHPHLLLYMWYASSISLVSFYGGWKQMNDCNPTWSPVVEMYGQVGWPYWISYTHEKIPASLPYVRLTTCERDTVHSLPVTHDKFGGIFHRASLPCLLAFLNSLAHCCAYGTLTRKACLDTTKFVLSVRGSVVYSCDHVYIWSNVHATDWPVPQHVPKTAP